MKGGEVVGAAWRASGSDRYERPIVESLLRTVRVRRTARTCRVQHPGIDAPAAARPVSSEAPADEPARSGRPLSGPPQAPDSRGTWRLRPPGSADKGLPGDNVCEDVECHCSGIRPIRQCCRPPVARSCPARCCAAPRCSGCRGAASLHWPKPWSRGAGLSQSETRPRSCDQLANRVGKCGVGQQSTAARTDRPAQRLSEACDRFNGSHG